MILFETRLGCLQEDVPEDIVHFINAINNMFTLSELVILLPRWSRTFLPLWKRFFQAWDDLSGVGNGDGRRPFVPSNLVQFSDYMCMFLLLCSPNAHRSEGC